MQTEVEIIIVITIVVVIIPLPTIQHHPPSGVDVRQIFHIIPSLVHSNGVELFFRVEVFVDLPHKRFRINHWMRAALQGVTESLCRQCEDGVDRIQNHE